MVLLLPRAILAKEAKEPFLYKDLLKIYLKTWETLQILQRI